MQLLTVLLACLLSLTGGEGPSRQTRLTVASGEGLQPLLSRTTLGGGLATFRCLSSRTGTCHYRLYEEQCQPASAAGSMRQCQRQDLRSFNLTVGASRQLQGLPAHFSQCVDAVAGRCS